MPASRAVREGPGPDTQLASPRAGLGEGLLEAYLHCPDCGRTEFRVVSDGEAVNFLCLSCQRCWHPEAGYLSRVDPLTCPGCSARSLCLCPIVAPLVDYALGHGLSAPQGAKSQDSLP
jgi:hypothetical protein